MADASSAWGSGVGGRESGQRLGIGWAPPAITPAARLTIEARFRPPARPAGGAHPTPFGRALATAARRTVLPATVPSGPIRAVAQGNPGEYDSAAQASVWSGSTCSAAALTAVL